MTETDTEEKLTYAIVIFRYIEDKDMFQKVYAFKQISQSLLFYFRVSY